MAHPDAPKSKSPKEGLKKAEKKTGKLSKIRSGALSRGFALARVSLSAGARAATHAVGGLLASAEDKPERMKALLVAQAEILTQELGQLKGSLMKVGQMLSMLGEYFLPAEANQFLKSLQSESPPLDWPEIEKVLKRQLGEEKLAQLEIERESIASASMGQVHRARRKSDGRLLALKVQYPGVDQAIESDLKALRSILSIAKIVPKGPSYDELFKEVRMMLHQEVDYARELKLTEEYREALKGDPRYIVPETFPEFSTARVLATSYEEGLAVNGPEILALPLERRNGIARAALDLYFREIFEFRMMQTDPHFGNYRVRLGENGEPDRLVLLDFGAVRKFPKAFMEPYHELARATVERDEARLLAAAVKIGFDLPEEKAELRRCFADVSLLIAEPFFRAGDPGAIVALLDEEGCYRWDESDLPKRASLLSAQLALHFKLKPPPREIVFLDRKMAGVFVFLSVLKARLDARGMLDGYLDTVR